MKYSDIRKAITNTQQKLFGGVYYENINKIKRPCYYVELVDYKKEFNGLHSEYTSITIDILCFPTDAINYRKSEIIEMMEAVDNNFEIQDPHGYKRGLKILKITPNANDTTQDRFLLVQNVEMQIVDGVGHYTFDLGLYDVYGLPYDYELMQDLELKFKKE